MADLIFVLFPIIEYNVPSSTTLPKKPLLWSAIHPGHRLRVLQDVEVDRPRPPEAKGFEGKPFPPSDKASQRHIKSY